LNYFTLSETPLIDLKIITRNQKKDNRGYFSRLFCPNDLKNIGWHDKVIQINESFTSRQGTIRGLHYQKQPWSEVKIVSCVKGRVFDVAVDLRRNSETYLKWYGLELSSDNAMALFIPEGFAHGFQVLSDDALLIYVHSKPYTSEADAGVNPFDKKLAIQWPLSIGLVSDRDNTLPFIDLNFNGI
jgi:dTDP-4-dehydrorhamnose 3,5-epimerase